MEVRVTSVREALGNAPAPVRALLRKGAYLVGSRAERLVLGLPEVRGADYDVLVPFAQWNECTHLIPMTARPNGRRGWRFLDNADQIDVWPDTLDRFFQEATNAVLGNGKPGKPHAYAVDQEGFWYSGGRPNAAPEIQLRALRVAAAHMTQSWRTGTPGREHYVSEDTVTDVEELCGSVSDAIAFREEERALLIERLALLAEQEGNADVARWLRSLHWLRSPQEL